MKLSGYFGIIFLVFFPLMSFAQVRNMRTPAAVGTGTAGSSVDIGVGFTQSAINVGAQYEKKNGDFGFGGYFFLQSKKERNSVVIVNDVLSLGGQMKTHVLQTNRVDAYLAPGFGIHMFKDVIDSGARKVDVTAFGPTLNIGVLFPLTHQFSVGLDRFEIWNWFDEKAPNSVSVYRAMLSIGF